MMTAEIFIKNLAVRCKIGIIDAERSHPQPLIINISVAIDPSIAIKSDDVKDTINYSLLHGRIIEAITSSSFNLLESLANCLADICLENPMAKSVRITIEKPYISQGVESSGITVVKQSKPTE